VPLATITEAKKCAHCGTSLRPKSMMPRNPASRKNAVSPSYPSSGAVTLAVASANSLQLVPNWNGMTIPDTTPMPNDTAKIFTQKSDSRR